MRGTEGQIEAQIGRKRQIEVYMETVSVTDFSFQWRCP